MPVRALSHRAGRPLAIALVALSCAACGTQARAPSVTVSRAASHAASSGASSGASSTTTTSAARAGRLAPTGPLASASTVTASGQATATSTTPALPGAGHPPIELGDKNYTEQEILGQLYAQALEAEGYTVTVNQNIGPAPVTLQALENGSLMAYPEYLSTFDSQIAGYRTGFKSVSDAYEAGLQWAASHGLVLMEPTKRLSDTHGIAVTDAYAAANHLRVISDLQRVSGSLAIGGPPQFQADPPGLEQVSATYGVVPTAFKAVAIGDQANGDQYAALNAGTIQAAEVNTTDGQLSTGDYVVLEDPAHVFGFGNVVPVISAKALAVEGPAFQDTLTRVDRYLTTAAMRELNQLVDVAQQTPATVARQFLQTHGLLTPQPF